MGKAACEGVQPSGAEVAVQGKYSALMISAWPVLRLARLLYYHLAVAR